MAAEDFSPLVRSSDRFLSRLATAGGFGVDVAAVDIQLADTVPETRAGT
jgi:hypothetical protein